MPEQDIGMENYIKLKGLPFKATPEDIIGFFMGFEVPSDSIFLKRHPDGRPNGEAFIAFGSADEARRAIQKDREVFGDKFGDRYVRVYPVLDTDAADMQAARHQNSFPPQSNCAQFGHSDSVVKIKSLPFDANQLDIIQFFEGFRLKPNGVQLVLRSDNKPTGEAFVDFESSEEAARAVREHDHKVFSEKYGERYVRLIQVSRKEMQVTLALRFGGEGIIKMKGIPFKATAADVRKFFSSGNYRIKPDGISFIMHTDGRPTGMAFIEFESPQDAVRSMEKDRAKFGPEHGDRFCMLQLVGRHEMAKVTLLKESATGGGPPGLGQAKGGLHSGLAGLGNMPIGNPLGADNPLLGMAWLHHMGLLNQSMMGMGPDLQNLGFNPQLNQLAAFKQLQGMGPPGAPHPGDHLSQLQQLLQSNPSRHPLLDAIMAGSQMNGHPDYGNAFLQMQNQAMPMHSQALSRQGTGNRLMPPSRSSSDGRGEQDDMFRMAQSISEPMNLANAATNLMLYNQQQQQQDWARAALAEARSNDMSSSNWVDQLVGMNKHSLPVNDGSALSI